jgi:hypothetical protein
MLFSDNAKLRLLLGLGSVILDRSKGVVFEDVRDIPAILGPLSYATGQPVVTVDKVIV